MPRSTRFWISAVGLIVALSLPATADSPYSMNDIAENPELALDVYFYEQFSGFSVQGSGSLRAEISNPSVSFMAGGRRGDKGFDMLVLCGVFVDGTPDENLHEPLSTGCEKEFLHTVKKLSQPAEPGPYRAAGPSAIEWQSRTVTLITSEVAYVIEGRYTSSQDYRPCLWIDSCCKINGALYLDSCREPTEAEWKTIDYCQSMGLGCRSDKYMACLREQGLKVGCESQDDGSRICY